VCICLTTSHASVVYEESSTCIDGDKVVLINEDDLSLPIETEAVRIGTAEQIREYRNIRDQLDFHEFKSAALSVRDQEAYDAVIDTSKGKPETLAAELVTKLESLDAVQQSPPRK
jgi:hypothetical protein